MNLATNALKYGGISTNNGDLLVNWEFTGSGKSKRLQLDWIETSAETISEPEGTGFGSRLIDANIRGELGGTIDRSFRPNGMTGADDHPALTCPRAVARIRSQPLFSSRLATLNSSPPLASNPVARPFRREPIALSCIWNTGPNRKGA
ncbi:hypothetical protein [uncultured Roseibium sp.]|uniref:hypothetical protein n=1 Tax=uncultured Roseibium sp. TaxID=1936171 RepID=UPI003217EC90